MASFDASFGARGPRLNLYWREVTVLPAGKHFAYEGTHQGVKDAALLRMRPGLGH